MREHLYARQGELSARELFGEQLHFAGGNDMLAVFNGWGPPSVGPTPVAQLGSSVPMQTQARGAAVSNTSGGSCSLGRVQITTAVLFAGAVLILVALNRAGFKFSVTVG